MVLKDMLNKRWEDDDDDDDDDGAIDMSEDCGAEHACLGEGMTTRGHCILTNHNGEPHAGPHYCGWCGTSF